MDIITKTDISETLFILNTFAASFEFTKKLTLDTLLPIKKVVVKSIDYVATNPTHSLFTVSSDLIGGKILTHFKNTKFVSTTTPDSLSFPSFSVNISHKVYNFTNNNTYRFWIQDIDGLPINLTGNFIIVLEFIF